MPNIIELDSDTINKIAAGEVIERPSAVVKELVENAIDAKANAITIEIKEGGISFIRITDNGKGIEEDDMELAFKRHSTSKIRSVEDLMTVTSLGFRGEALSSIAAVACVELITKPHSQMLGTRYVIEGGVKKSSESIGCPEGTTFIVRNLFFNTPVRRKFLKTPATEAGYISSVVEKMSAAHPEIAFKFIVNGQLKIHTTGNSNLKDIIYTLYGRDITANLLEINSVSGNIKVEGYIGKPVISRGNRNMEIYYINGRAIKSAVIAKAIEEAYKSYTMVHRYPFVALHISMDPSLIDVNVHPTKMEVRFSNSEQVYYLIFNAIKDVLSGKNLIQNVHIEEDRKIPAPETGKPVVRTLDEKKAPEPFEKSRIIAQTEIGKLVNTIKSPEPVYKQRPNNITSTTSEIIIPKMEKTPKRQDIIPDEPVVNPPKDEPVQEVNIPEKTVQTSLFDSEDFKKDNTNINFKIIGQLFLTYWIVECDNNMYIIDQHAAHEKVLFEKTMAAISESTQSSQMISPPIILTLNMNQENILKQHLDDFKELGYDIEHFGGREYSVSSVPANLPGVADESLLIEMLDELYENDAKKSSTVILEKVASLSCKAAVKGNNRLSYDEAVSLITELMHLDNPFNCPHGRPTIISMSKAEIEKKFKRIV